MIESGDTIRREKMEKERREEGVAWKRRDGRKCIEGQKGKKIG